MRFLAARDVLQRAIAAHAFPAAVIEVGDAGRPLWTEAFGRLTFDATSPVATEHTIFDLASLTKVLSTAPLVMRQVERGTLGLDDPVARHVAGWRGSDREHVTVRDLLAHCGGLPAHRDLYRECCLPERLNGVPFSLPERLNGVPFSGRVEFERAICATPLEYEPRSQSIYSDLGFMLLGFILEDVAPLAAQFDALRLQMGGIQDLQFHPPGIWKTRTAPTQVKAARGGLLVGDVDDDNTWALGGASGQAGLFGTAAAVGECARHVLQVLEGRTGAFNTKTLEEFTRRRADIPDSSRALGWDTMLPTSSCGTRMSPRAFGHTGYTGTSLWIDPDRGIYVVFLTNRVHPDASNEAIKNVRPVLHDAVMEAVLLAG